MTWGRTVVTRPAIAILGLALFLSTIRISFADQETIAIIGTGDLGDSFGVRLAELGYTVVYGSRTPDSERVKKLVASTGNGASAASQQEAARQGDIVFLPIPWPAMETAAKMLGDLDGKIIVDPSAPWTQGDDGYPESRLETSSAELIQKWNPNAKVVKALATMSSNIIDEPDMAGGFVTIPIASDHRDAKERVAQLVADLGFDPVDFGPLRMARLIEAMDIIYMIPLLQRRSEEWEFFFRRNRAVVCWWQADWAGPVFDADNLAEMPEVLEPPAPCP
jgi:predicted dinucleotide-binding enzyme